jgi:hypothetical protein
MLIGVVVLEVVVGVILLNPGYDDNCWISLTKEVLEAPESWSDLMLDQEFQLSLCGIRIREWGQMKM